MQAGRQASCEQASRAGERGRRAGQARAGEQAEEHGAHKATASRQAGEVTAGEQGRPTECLMVSKQCLELSRKLKNHKKTCIALLK